MRVFDTSVWIERLIGTLPGQKFNHAFEAIESCVVPSLVQFELYRWHLRERTQEEAGHLLAFSMSGIVVPLDSQTAVHAAELSREHRLHATDAIIYATARLIGGSLVTFDSHFNGLPGVEFMSK